MGKAFWILNHYAISPDMPGGTRHFDLALELVKKGHDVTIFASGFDHSTRTYSKIDPEAKMKVEVYDGVRFVWINTFPYAGNDWRRVVNMVSYGWCWIMNHYATNMFFNRGGRHYWFGRNLDYRGYEPVIFCPNVVHEMNRVVGIKKRNHIVDEWVQS